ncbi:MAG: SDR family oxidoreductase [Anaerolineaceae bacterium]|nr:MAG: SDR family oxidoreductase [Anaerolineaceae bacterium]
MKTYETLKDKVVLISGAGRGIGRALAMGFSEEGACVACLARTASEIDKTAEEIRSAGGRAVSIPCDVTNLQSMEDACKLAAEAFGGIDIIIVNAGVNNVREKVGEDDPELWRNTIDVNLIGAYYSIRACIPYLKERGAGKIITIGSGRGRRGDATGSSYSCSKSALWMLVRVLAEELREYDITVNELIPGPVVTDMNKKFVKDNLDTLFTDGIEWVKEPEDIVPLAVFMATLPKKGPTAQSFSLTRREI